MIRRGCLAVETLLLAACGGGSGRSGAPTPVAPSPLDTELTTLAKSDMALTGDPATPRGAAQVPPDTDELVKLGQLLFCSQTLGAGYDVSCGTCHHPDFGASDGLSISVGVVPQNAHIVGPGRTVDALRDRDAQTDGGPKG